MLDPGPEQPVRHRQLAEFPLWPADPGVAGVRRPALRRRRAGGRERLPSGRLARPPPPGLARDRLQALAARRAVARPPARGPPTPAAGARARTRLRRRTGAPPPGPHPTRPPRPSSTSSLSPNCKSVSRTLFYREAPDFAVMGGGGQDVDDGRSRAVHRGRPALSEQSDGRGMGAGPILVRAPRELDRGRARDGQRLPPPRRGRLPLATAARGLRPVADRARLLGPLPP